MKQGVFIKGAAAISPQKSFDEKVFNEGFVFGKSNRKMCAEPDYSQYIDSKQIRRMSRIIRMSVATSIASLRNAGLEKPEAVIVGTAFGCLDDTYAFLSKLVQFKEDMLSPTAFIHSTHNTIAAQIALHYKCYGYNSTYVHRSVSFESALADAVMLLQDSEVNNVLVGGADEIIDAGFTIMERMGQFKQADGISSSDLYPAKSNGTIAGEGTAFFSLVREHSLDCLAEVAAVESWTNISQEQVIENIRDILQNFQATASSSILISGMNGDAKEDAITSAVTEKIIPDLRSFNYKHLCGDYGTSTAFASWLAAHMLKKQITPKVNSFENITDTPLKNILIYNQVNNLHHSVILLKAC